MKRPSLQALVNSHRELVAMLAVAGRGERDELETQLASLDAEFSRRGLDAETAGMVCRIGRPEYKPTNGARLWMR